MLRVVYDVTRDVVMIQSPISGQVHAFDLEHLDDFLDWLKSSRHSREPWHDFEMVYRFVDESLMVVVHDGQGSVHGFLSFCEKYYLDQVKALEEAIAGVKKDMVVPAREMKAAGMSPERVAQALDVRNLFSLPVLWSMS